jgi:hypothetical protein
VGGDAALRQWGSPRFYGRSLNLHTMIRSHLLPDQGLMVLQRRLKCCSRLRGALGIPSPHQPILEALNQSQQMLGRRQSRALGNLARYCTYERQMEVKPNDA